MTVNELRTLLADMPGDRRVVMFSISQLAEVKDCHTWDDCAENRHEVWISDKVMNRDNPGIRKASSNNFCSNCGHDEKDHGGTCCFSLIAGDFCPCKNYETFSSN